MSKNKIESISRDNFFDKTKENEMINDISRAEFMAWMEENGYDANRLRKLFEEKRISSVEQSKFNYLLKKTKKELKISIVDCVLYLDELMDKIKKIVSCLDEDTKYMLKSELAKKYKINLKNNYLYKFMEF
jgi:hypothetical protein